MPRKIFLIALILFFTVSVYAKTQPPAKNKALPPLEIPAEVLTITTYYPSPYGSYNELKLQPHDKPTVKCDNFTEGTLYYNSEDDLIYLCRGDGWSALSAGAGFWTTSQSKTYPNNIYNTNAGNVRIGADMAGRIDYPQPPDNDGNLYVDDIYVTSTDSWLSQGKLLAVGSYAPKIPPGAANETWGLFAANQHKWLEFIKAGPFTLFTEQVVFVTLVGLNGANFDLRFLDENDNPVSFAGELIGTDPEGIIPGLGGNFTGSFFLTIPITLSAGRHSIKMQCRSNHADDRAAFWGYSGCMIKLLVWRL